MIALLLDTETTGLIENHSVALDRQPEIIEFFGLVASLKTGKVKKTYHTMVRPRRAIQEVTTVSATGRKRRGITEITGISNVMVKDAPPFSEVAGNIKELIEKSETVIAQNASFDREMIDLEFERLGLSVTWPTILCTVEQSLHYCGFRLNLSALHEHLFGKKFSGAHRAEADVRALLACCVEMHKRGDL